MESPARHPAHAVPRYLAGQLSPSEAAAFEEAYASSPELIGEIEATLRLKEGLESLRDRGELYSLLRPTARRRWIGWAAAAAAIIAVAGLYHHEQHTLPPPSAVSIDRLPGLPVLHSYTLVRTREQSKAVVIPISSEEGAIELQILPAHSPSTSTYTVRMARTKGATRQELGALENVNPGSDRYVVVYVDRRRLSPGDYELSIAPTGVAGAGGQDEERFTLQVR